LFLPFHYPVAVFLGGKFSLFHFPDVFPQGAKNDFGRMGVFFYEFGGEGLKLADRVRDDQQLAVAIRPGPDG
jgi:hypothetical protein